MKPNAHWSELTVADCLDQSVQVERHRKLTRDYKSKGSYPIVDQGRDLISGWTDDPTGLISSSLPMVIFGDHTRAFKFVDFPFVRGADGTHLLRPKSGIDPRFFYYSCLNIGLPSRGYNRHFSLLREQVVRIPQKSEQQAIANSLYLVERAIEANRAVLASLDALKSETARELFARGLRGEAQKQLQFGSVPESWAEEPLSSVAEVQTGAAKGRKFEDADAVDVPYLRVANVQDGHLDLTEMKSLRIRKSETERYRLRSNDVVLTEGGDFDKLGRGFIWRDELPLCIHQNHVFAVRTKADILLPDFFAYLAQSPYGKAYFLQVAHKTTNLACINSTKLKAFPVVLPTPSEQREIVEVVAAIDKKLEIHLKKRLVLEQLFQSLLHKLMTGEISASDLALSALDTP